MPQDRNRRKFSSSPSPGPSKHKRSWQNSSGPDLSGRPIRRRSPSPGRPGGKRGYKAAGHSKFSGPSRDRPRSRSPNLGRGSPTYPRHGSAGGPGQNRNMSNPGAGPRQHSLSPRPGFKRGHSRDKREKHSYRQSPGPAPSGPSSKKKPRRSLTPPRKRPRSRSPVAPARKTDAAVSKSSSLPHRKVTSGDKKKSARITLDKRFTQEDQEPFELIENVTIAILRNPNAEPSEEVTVTRVFDSSLFKMVHKKTEGRKPIFDREEIKVWRHDDNLADDPDFERRLVRVKSVPNAKRAPDSLSRMSPGVLKKAFGLQEGGHSKSRSPHREPKIRLDPRPDPRYESKFRQQMEKEQSASRRRSGEDGGREGEGTGKSRDRKREDERSVSRREGSGGKGETYDLRQALERRRRSDRDEGNFRIEVHRSKGDPDAELFYREDQRGGSRERRRQIGDDIGDGRSVVMDRSRDMDGHRPRFGSSPGRREERSSQSRGRGGKGRREWTTDRGAGEGNFRIDTRRDGRDRDGSPQMGDHRPRFNSNSPPQRGWRGGFRGRGRARNFSFGSSYDTEVVSPSDIDDSFKYIQHDDRDVSPKPFRGRGGRRFPARSFGSSSFRGTNRGFRGNNRGFTRGAFRGRGFGSSVDRSKSKSLINGPRKTGSPTHSRDASVESEWKHDMYATLQTDEEQPHNSTGVGT